MDFNNTQAIYLQIADYVCDQIQLQRWQTDDKIPYIVIDGVLKGKNRNVESLKIPWFVNSNGNHQTAEIKYPKVWEDIVYTSVIRDTLFISLEKDKISETKATELQQQIEKVVGRKNP